MNCTYCSQLIGSDGMLAKAKSYFGTVSYAEPSLPKQPFHKECYPKWWEKLTWNLDDIDERMNANIYFHRINGLKGEYRNGKVCYPAHASWNGLEVRSMGFPYEFKHRKPCPL